MFNQNQKQNIILEQLREQLPSSQTLVRIDPFYKAFYEVSVLYREKGLMEIDGVVQSILNLLEVELHQNKTSDFLTGLLGIEKADFNRNIQRLQELGLVKKSNNSWSKANTSVEYETYLEKLFIIDPQTNQVVDRDVHYHIPMDQLYPPAKSVNWNKQLVVNLDAQLEGAVIQTVQSRLVGGDLMQLAIIYDEPNQQEKHVLYHLDGTEIEVMHLEDIDPDTYTLLDITEADLTAVSLVEWDQVLQHIGTTNFTLIIKDEMPPDFTLVLQNAMKQRVLYYDLSLPTEQVKALKRIEQRSKGLLTLIGIEHDWPITLLTDDYYYILTDEIRRGAQLEILGYKRKQLEQFTINIAKQANDEGLYTFNYLIEKRIDVATMRRITDAFLEVANSDQIIQRGRILERILSYEKLSKELYEIGVMRHGEEMKSK